MAITDQITNSLKLFLKKHPVSRLWVAYSGGLDSTVLLHALAKNIKLLPAIKLRAIHINHSINAQADIWQAHCADFCASLGVDYYSKNVFLDPRSSKSIEMQAREQRYQVFENIILPGDGLVLAHHLDDQVETVLLRLVKGSGIKGLAAMKSARTFAHGYLFRPFLNIPRDHLVEYAKQHQLKWVEDTSNQDLQYERNFLRNEILPKLKERWPQVGNNIRRTAENCAESEQLLEMLLADTLIRCQGQHLDTLSITQLKQLDDKAQRQVIRCWLDKLGFRLPSRKKIQQLQHDMLYSAYDRNPVIAWEGVELRRYQDELYAMPPLEPHDFKSIIPWDLQTRLVLPSGVVNLLPEHISGLEINLRSLQNTTIRFRQGGEIGVWRGHKHSLKKLFQEWKVPPWLRNRVPLLYSNNELIAAILPNTIFLLK